MGDGDDHVLLGNEILDGEFAFVAGDLRAPLVAELFRRVGQLILHELHPLRLRGQ
ncbi:hypothetical protein D3C83_257840 [compost metagenome]